MRRMTRRGLGKLSVVLVFFLVLNSIGYMVVRTEVEDNNEYVQASTPLARFYQERGDGGYGMTNSSSLYRSIPSQPSDDILAGFQAFADRILLMFSFIDTILAFVLVPGTLFAIMGLPWQLAMMLEVPIAAIVILGIIDLFGGGDS